MILGKETEPVRVKSAQTCGRLTALAGRFALDEFVQPTLRGKVLYFPSMPETIELARKAEYVVTPPTRFIPDGIHVYKGTAPMEIPISFKLAANDSEYCPEGAYSILQAAALLHAMVLPIGNSSIPNKASYNNPTVGEPAAAKAQNPTDVNVDVSSAQEDSLRPPVTCLLELMRIGQSGPGIVCVGYVKDISTKFSGPWLRGPNQSYNLPSFCDFSFTFVHAPGYGNDYGKAGDLGQNVNAYADWILQRFYHTLDLSKKGDMRYRGFEAPAKEQTEIINKPNIPDSQVVVFDPAVDQLRYYTIGGVNGQPAQLMLIPTSNVVQNAPPTTVSMSLRDLPLSSSIPRTSTNSQGVTTPVTQQTLSPPQNAPQRGGAMTNGALTPQRFTLLSRPTG